jgi:hypothetical protein
MHEYQFPDVTADIEQALRADIDHAKEHFQVAQTVIASRALLDAIERLHWFLVAGHVCPERNAGVPPKA